MKEGHCECRRRDTAGAETVLMGTYQKHHSKYDWMRL